jgi:hypothetical protein
VWLIFIEILSADVPCVQWEGGSVAVSRRVWAWMLAAVVGGELPFGMSCLSFM